MTLAQRLCVFSPMCNIRPPRSQGLVPRLSDRMAASLIFRRTGHALFRTLSARRLGSLLWALGVSLTFFGNAQGQAVRAGLWEFDAQKSRLLRGKQTIDMQKIQVQMEAQLRGMDADTRRILEDNLRGAGIAVGRPQRSRLCVPSEQATLARVTEQSQQESCQFQLSEKGTDFVRGTLRCSDAQASGVLISTLITPERIHQRSELNTPQGQLIVTAQAQWLSADCGDASVIGTQSLQGRSLFDNKGAPASR